MKRSNCLKWAKALVNGKHIKHTKTMSDANGIEKEPGALCCLGVANELFKPEGYKKDRIVSVARFLSNAGILKKPNPLIFGLPASVINDGASCSDYQGLGVGREGMTHAEIGMLLLFAIESGEYKNI